MRYYVIICSSYGSRWTCLLIIKSVLTSTEVHSRQQAADPRHLSFTFTKIVYQLADEHAERVRDTVYDHITHKAGEYDNPTVSAVRWRR